jgi:DNA-binding MarR family transcriptional regulator
MADSRIEAILRLDIQLQREVYAHWPESWTRMKWPVGSIRALLLIESGFAHTPGEVAGLLKVGKTTVTGMLDRLEADQLISRAIDPNDRRSFVLEMTEAGRELVRQIDDLRREPLRRALERMSADELRALHQGLDALTKAMDTDEETVLSEAEEE